MKILLKSEQQTKVRQWEKGIILTQIIPSSPNFSFAAALATGLFLVGGQAHFMP